MVGHWEFTLGAERVKAIVDDARLPVPRPERARRRVERAGLRADGDARARRRQGRGDRPGLPLHADRQSALDDAELVVRHPRGGGAGKRRQGARRTGARARGAAVAQRLRRRPQARLPRARHRRDPHGAHPRRAARGGEGRQDAARRLGQPRQVRVAARPRRARRRGEGLSATSSSRSSPTRSRPTPRWRRRSTRIRGPARGHARRGGRPHRNAALPPRQLQRHARRRHLRRAASPSATPRSRCRRASAGATRCCPGRRSRARTSTTPPRSPIRPPTA